MNLREIITQLQKAKKNKKSKNKKLFEKIDYIPCDTIGSGVSMPVIETDDLSEKIEAYFYLPCSWICTDTRVGLRLYFATALASDGNNRILGYSIQWGRKFDEYFFWLDEWAVQYVRDSVIECIIRNNQSSEGIEYCKEHLDTDFDEILHLKGIEKTKLDSDEYNKKQAKEYARLYSARKK